MESYESDSRRSHYNPFYKSTTPKSRRLPPPTVPHLAGHPVVVLGGDVGGRDVVSQSGQVQGGGKVVLALAAPQGLQQEVAGVLGGQTLQAGGGVQGVPDQNLVHLQEDAGAFEGGSRLLGVGACGLSTQDDMDAESRWEYYLGISGRVVEAGL